MSDRLAALRARVKAKEEGLQSQRAERFASSTASQQDSRTPSSELAQRRPIKQLTPEQLLEQREKAQRRAELLKKLKAQEELADIVRRARPPTNFEEEEPPAKRACSEAGGPGMEPPQPEPPAAIDPREARCQCGLPPTEWTVRKEGPNQGRAFLKCPDGRCSFWEWADGRSQGAAPLGGPAGGAGGVTSSTSQVLGLGFSGPLASALVAGGRAPGGEAPAAPTPPSRPASHSMGFFEPQTPPPVPAAGSRVCSCGVGAVNFGSRRDGPHQGRRFWKCAEQRCKFFEWDDEPAGQTSGTPGGGGARPGAGGGGGGAGACFRCGKTGHFGRDCDSKPTGASTNVCFRCGQAGHFARDCTGSVCA